MKQILNLQWMDIITNSLWIFGLSIFLTILSYNEFRAYYYNIKRIKIYKNRHIHKLILIGAIFIVLGILSSSAFYIFSPSHEFISVKKQARFSVLDFDIENHMKITNNSVFLPWGGSIKLKKKVKFEKSPYEIKIVCKGDNVLQETARFKLYLNTDLVAAFYTPEKFETRTIEYQSKKEQSMELRIWFVNAYKDPQRNLDRNAWIHSIEIIKTN